MFQLASSNAPGDAARFALVPALASEALRTLAELDPRPWRIPASVPGGGAGAWRLTYSGPPLTPEQEAEVGRLIAWVRSSRPAAH